MKTKWTKKKTIILVVVIVAVVLAAFIGVVAVVAKSLSAGMPVETETVSQGSISQELDYSGTVATEEVKVYFSPVSAKVATVDVAVGDTVKAGDTLLTFDVAEMEENDAIAALQSKAEEQGISATITTINNTQNKQAEAIKSYDEAMQYVYHYSACLESANAQLNEAYAVKAEYDTLKATVDEYKILQGEYETPNPELAKMIADGEAQLAVIAEKMAQYDYAGLENAVQVCSKDMNDYKAIALEYEAQREGDPALATQKAQQNTLREINELTREQALADIETARAGIKADFNGVVTTVDTVEGQSVAEGVQIFTVESTDDLMVKITLAKHGLEQMKVGQIATVTIQNTEYEGVVTKISGKAEINANGASTYSAEIHIENPGEDIFLGSEAKIHIVCEEKENVVLVPVSGVNYDTNGTFCYVIEDGILTRREVEIGISNAEYMEIVNGLHTDDQIVTRVTPGMTEGMKVTPMESVE